MIDPASQPASDVAGMELAPGIRLPPAALRLQYARSSGPGGQNVNKISSKAELWVALDDLAAAMTPAALTRLRRLAGRRLTRGGEIHLASDTHRTQEANRNAVMQRLRELLVAAMVEPKIRRRTKPSRAAKQRRLETKRRRSEIKSRRQGPIE